MRLLTKLGAAATLAAAAHVVRDGNQRLVTISYTLRNPSLPAAFDGLRILHLSDLHAATFGKNQRRLLEVIDHLDADMVFITGDLIDRRRTVSDRSMQPALTLLKELSKRLPTVRVDGNHEPSSGMSARFQALADATAVQNVTGRALTVKKGDDRLVILGVPDMATTNLNEAAWEARMRELCAPYKDEFRLVLSHRPQFFDAYVRAGLPFVFCGHAHGGQFRLPLLGALYAPEQGILPKLTQGLHRRGNTQMLINRGLGNSGFPIRFGNYPEIGVITLRREPILKEEKGK